MVGEGCFGFCFVCSGLSGCWITNEIDAKVRVGDSECGWRRKGEGGKHKEPTAHEALNLYTGCHHGMSPREIRCWTGGLAFAGEMVPNGTV